MSRKRQRAGANSQTSQQSTGPMPKRSKTEVEAGDNTLPRDGPSGRGAPDGEHQKEDDGNGHAAGPATDLEQNPLKSAAQPSKAQHFTRPLRTPRWLYLKLAVINGPSSESQYSNLALDETTIRMHLLSALSTYLGDHGAAVPVDILKRSTNSRSVYVRVPSPDGMLFSAAVASWAGKGVVAGFRVLEKSPWLGCLQLAEEEALFDLTAG